MKFRWDKKYLYWGVTALLVIIGAISFYYLMFHSSSLKNNLYQLITIIMPVIDGLILAYLLWPIVSFLERRLLYPLKEKLTARFPSLRRREEKLKKYCRGISILLTIIFVLFMLSGFFRVVIPQIAYSIQNIISQFDEYTTNLSEWLEGILVNNPEFEEKASDLINTYSPKLEEWMNTKLIPQMNTIVKTVSLSMLGVAKALWNLVIGLIISIYLLGNKERFLNQMKKMTYAFFSRKTANAMIADAKLIDHTFGGFINGKILDSVIIGIICFFCVNIMDLPFPMLISVIIGVTNIIPFFGPFIGAVPCALLILMVNPWQCLYFIIFIFLLQQFDGNFLGPKILGGSTGLSGFWVIFSITLFSGLMGVAGLILGVPVFAVFYTLLRRRINHNLKKKGMPLESENYAGLSRVDLETGAFIKEEGGSAAAGKAWSWRSVFGRHSDAKKNADADSSK